MFEMTWHYLEASFWVIANTGEEEEVVRVCVWCGGVEVLDCVSSERRYANDTVGFLNF